VPTDAALTEAVVAGILVTAIVGVLVTWMIRCGAQFHSCLAPSMSDSSTAKLHRRGSWRTPWS